MDWQPIATAPRTREDRIDLCLLNRATGERWRAVECRWAGDWGWQDRSGKSVCGRRVYDGGREGFDPLCEDGRSVVATHWMHPPALPEATGFPDATLAA